jgi:small nuclear ribonucleoprotein (snRNP)-like protein
MEHMKSIIISYLNNNFSNGELHSSDEYTFLYLSDVFDLQKTLIRIIYT